MDDERPASESHIEKEREHLRIPMRRTPLFHKTNTRFLAFATPKSLWSPRQG